jgi:hypothetical protein
VSVVKRITGLFASPDERARRKVLDAPRVAIAAAVEGAHLQVRGRIVASEGAVLLTAPFTGRAVVWFHARYEALHRNDDQNDLIAAISVLNRDHKPAEWVTELTHAEGCHFFIDDGSGMLAGIDGRVARVLASEHRVSDSTFLDREPPEFQAVMNAHGLVTTLYMGVDVEKRFWEGSVAAGDEVVVAGIARRTAGAPEKAGYRSSATTYVAMEEAVVTTP